MEAIVAPRITKTPGVCGGRACIAGHRIRVMDIVAWHDRGMTPEEMIGQFPGLDLLDVEAALAYYAARREEIDDDLRRDRQAGEWAAANVPSPLRGRPGG